MARTIDQLDIWLTDASVNSVKWWKKLNSKLYLKLSTQNLKNMFFLDLESKYERIFEFETMFLSCLFKELLPFENCKMYRNVLKNKKLSNKTTLKLRLESDSLKVFWWPNMKEFLNLKLFLSCLFKELLPFENCKMYRNVLKKKFLNGHNSLENACMAFRFGQ